MAEAIQVQSTGALERFIHERVDGGGMYSSAGEYLQELVRRNFEKEEERKWGWLRDELKADVEADESEFLGLDVADLLERVRSAHGVWADGSDEELLAEPGRLR